MKRVMVSFVLLSLVLMTLFNASLILAEEDNDSNKNKGETESISNDNDSEKNTLISGTNVRVRERDRTEEKVRREFKDVSGRDIRVDRQVKIEDGMRQIIIERKITDENGNEIEEKIVIKETEDGIKRKVIVEREEGDIEVDTELEIESDLIEGESTLRVKTKNGTSQSIEVLPDRAREIARQRLRIHAENMGNITLEEIREGNMPKVVYKLASEHPGKFLGIFKTAMKAETRIDPETGDILNVNKPWWAFLVNEEQVSDTEETAN